MVVIHFFEVLKRSECLIFGSDCEFPFISALFLAVQLLINDMLNVWHVMQAWAGEFVVVVGFAELAVVDFKLIGNIAALVSQKTVKFVVHIAGSEGFDEGLVVQGIKH